MDITLYADALMLMGALGLSIYCLSLHRQLKRLQRTDRGIGQAIENLTAATRASQQANRDIKMQIGSALTDIDRKLEALRGRRTELDDVLDAVDGQVKHQMRRCDEARTLTEQALTPLLERAELEIQALTAAIEVSARLSQRPLKKVLKEATVTEDTNNPFLRAVNG